MANTLLEANRAAHEAREREADRLERSAITSGQQSLLSALELPEPPTYFGLTPATSS
jgi:hypothetical protein